jgi:hypothetical protein
MTKLGVPATEARRTGLIWIGVAWSLLMIWLSVVGGVQEGSDYYFYIQQWKLVLSGADPWSTTNTYGPLHNVFAYLLPISDLAPKILFSVTLIIANGLLVREIMRVSGVGGVLGVYLLAVPTNFIIISMAFISGHNDSLVAAFIIFAVVARVRGHLAFAGGILGMAIVLKYYPAFLVPLFALEEGRFRLRLIAGAGAVTVVGLAAATFIWGDAFLTAWIEGVRRGPNLLSILSSLQFYPSLGEYVHVDFLNRYNAGIVLLVGIASIFTAWKLRLHWLEASVIGLAAILLTYKVGNQQFYIPWLFLVASLPLAETSSGRRLSAICLPLVLFLSAFQLGYSYDYYLGRDRVIRFVVGFLAFPLGVGTIATYLCSLRGDRLEGAKPRR